jgi:hypothetical protein
VRTHVLGGKRLELLVQRSRKYRITVLQGLDQTGAVAVAIDGQPNLSGNSSSADDVALDRAVATQEEALKCVLEALERPHGLTT